jgi:SP family general alpha glucoside:H+ symporter-like MFS transporter
MEAYCVFLMGNFIAMPAFAKEYGYWNDRKEKYVIVASWQSALQMGGPVGAIMVPLRAASVTAGRP